MPNYLTKELQKCKHPTPWWAQYESHQWTRPNYGATKQLENTLDNSPPITEECKRRIQKIVGNFLYYARAADCTMMTSLNQIAKKQARPTQNTKSAIEKILEYASTNTTAVVKFRASDMVLHIDIDAS